MSSTHHLPERPALGERDASERLSPDDMATLHEQQFIEAALRHQQQLADKVRRGVAGLCSNCASQCSSQAVYCDDECRADHEHREQVHLRQHGRR